MQKRRPLKVYGETASKRSQRFRWPNVALERLINAMKLLPPGFTLPSIEDAVRRVESSTSKQGRHFNKFESALKDVLAELPQQFRYYVWGPDRQRDELHLGAVDRYEEFRIARQKLSGLAQVNNLATRKVATRIDYLDPDRSPDETPLELKPLSLGIDDFTHFGRWLRESSGTTTKIDEQGRIQHVPDWFGRATEGVELAKIRICQVCGHVFWAGRKDAWQCGESNCKSTWSSRLNRDPELRKKYYQNRKAIHRMKDPPKKAVARIEKGLSLLGISSWRDFKPTKENIKDLAAMADTTIIQTENVLDFLKRKKLEIKRKKKEVEPVVKVRLVEQKTPKPKV